jgi:glycosyltransferase involved in cell wall biosynthesis
MRSPAAKRLHAAFVLEQHVGHAVQAIHLRRELAKADLDLTYVPVTFFKPGGFVERLGFLPAALRASVRARFEVKDGLLGREPDVLFWNTQKPAVLYQSLVERIPSVISLDVTPVQYDDLGAEYGHSPDRLRPLANYKHKVNKRVFNLARHLLPATSWVARSLVSDYGVPPEKIEVLPPGTDLERFQPSNRGGTNTGPLKVLFVGGDFRRKGGDIVLDWFRSIDPATVELHLVTRDKLQTPAGVLVHRLSYDDEGLPALYQQADVFVLPTRAECFGLVLTEAMAAGLPCVTCAVGGLDEVVEDGVTGLLTQPADVTSFRQAMDLLTNDAALRERMARAARERAAERFDAKKNVRRIVEILRECVAETAGAREEHR